MSNDRVERNKATFRLQQERILSAGGDLDLEVMKKVFAPDFVRHRSGTGHIAQAMGGPQYPPDLPIYERQRRGFAFMLGSFPHQERIIHQVIGEGDWVAARWTIKTKWEGPLLGFPPTGQEVEFEEFAVIRFDEEGRMLEAWFILDELGMLQDLGLLKVPVAEKDGA
jgi:hypothetical protein